MLASTRASSREYLSAKLVEFRATTTWDPGEQDESAERASATERRREQVRAATSLLEESERLLVEDTLAGKCEDEIANELGVNGQALEEIMRNAILKMSTTLSPSNDNHRPGTDLRRQASTLGISGTTKPDRAAAARLFNRTQRGANYVDMTPALALAVLERNTDNRRLDRDRVQAYARDMSSGDWHANNQGIAIGADNLLHDGQHRLWAVALSGRTVPLLVITGATTEARGTIDQGRSRSIGDGLHMLHGQVRGNAVVSWLRAIDLLHSKRCTPMSLPVARRELSRFEGSVSWFLTHGPRARPYARASVLGALIYAHAVTPAHVEAFTRRYVSGAQLEEGSPVLALRSYVAERMRRDIDSPRAISLRTLSCLLADVRGEQLQRINAGEAGFVHYRELHAADTTASQPSAHRAAESVRPRS